jgi:hypothetical protein
VWRQTPRVTLGHFVTFLWLFSYFLLFVRGATSILVLESGLIVFLHNRRSTEPNFLLFIILPFMMNTRSGRSYGDNQLSQQQWDDLLLDVVHQLDSISSQIGSISKQVDVIWDQLVDKPECVGEKEKGGKKENETPQGSETNEETLEVNTNKGWFHTPHHEYKGHPPPPNISTESWPTDCLATSYGSHGVSWLPSGRYY